MWQGDLSTQPIASIMDPGPLTLSGATTVRGARELALPGHVIVVIEERGPVGILLEEQLARLHPERPLAHCEDHILTATRTSPEALVEEVLRNLWEDDLVRWHVAMSGPDAAGVVSPNALLREWRRRTQAMVSESHATRQEVLNAALAPTELWGNPTEVQNPVCYRCHAVSPPHFVRSGRVRQRDQYGQALCPDHGSVMSSENPCTGTPA